MAAGLHLGVGMLGGFAVTSAVLGVKRRYDFAGKVAVVTGGSRGLGLALARELARRGARLALCARDEAELEDARRELQGAGADVFVAPCDVSNQDDVRHFVQRVRETLGQIDVLVNNAGVIEVGPLEAMDESDFEEAMQTHFYGPLYFSLEIAPELRRRRDGRIINISSVGGKVAVPHLAPYCASKFALTGFSDSLRSELSKDNVYVTTVCPGLLRTGSALHAKFKGKALEEYALFKRGAVLPLVTMEPSRAARRIINASSYGRAELILTPQAKLAVKARALFPELVLNTTGLVERFLPNAHGGTTEQIPGEDLEPPRGGSVFDRLLRYTALRFNEYRA